jgi:hypothetical protein
MKRKFFYVLIGAAIVTAAAWNVGQSLNKNEMALSDVALANVEALGQEITLDCTALPYCSSTCPWEWCGYCMGFYMQECIL